MSRRPGRIRTGVIGYYEIIGNVISFQQAGNDSKRFDIMRVLGITITTMAALAVAFVLIGTMGSDDNVDGLVNPNATVTLIDDLVYNGNDQNLVNPGTADVPGTFEYSFFEDVGYSENIPTGHGAREYEIYYNFTPEDTATYETKTHVYAGSVEIGKAPVSNVTTTFNPTYAGYSQKPELVNLSFNGMSVSQGPAEGDVTVAMKNGYDGTSAGTQIAIVTVFSDSNFADGSTEVTYTINKATITTVGVSNISYRPVYDGTQHIPPFNKVYFDSWSVSNGPAENKVSITLKEGSDGIGAGTQNIIVTVTNDQNFNNFTGETSYVIDKADTDIVISGVPNLKYDSPDKHLVTRTGNSEQRIRYTLNGNPGDLSIPRFTNAGTYTVGYQIYDSNNYKGTDWQYLDVTVAKADAVVTLESKQGKCQGDNALIPSVQLQGQMEFDGTIVVTYYTNEACTEGATTTAPKNVGSYWVIANIPAQDNYNAATSNKATLVVKHDMVHVDKEGNVAEHYDCKGCHRHYLDEDGEREYFIPDTNNEVLIDSKAETDKTDPTKAKADASGSFASIDTALADEPEARIVAEIVTDDKNVTTIIADASQVKTLADKGAYVKMTNVLSSAEFSPDMLKALNLSSGDFEFSAKTTDVPDKYKDKVGEGAVVVDLKLNAAGTAVTQFGEKVKITVSYVLPEGADVSKLKVLFLGEDGIEVFDCTYDETAKTISFETDHFSEYAISKDYHSDNGGGNDYTLIIVIAIAVVAALVIAFILWKVKTNKQ